MKMLLRKRLGNPKHGSINFVKVIGIIIVLTRMNTSSIPYHMCDTFLLVDGYGTVLIWMLHRSETVVGVKKEEMRVLLTCCIGYNASLMNLVDGIDGIGPRIMVLMSKSWFVLI